MKKVIILLAILSQFKAFTQPYIQMQAGNKNIGMSIGAQAQGGILIDLGYTFPYNAADKAKIANFSIGKVINLTNEDEDNLSITPYIGYAYLSWNEEKNNFTPTSEFKPIYRLELAKDWYHGRLFVSANYSKDVFFTIGMKGFIF